MTRASVRAADTLWTPFGRGMRSKSSRLRQYFAWRIDNRDVALGTDPGAGGGYGHGFLVPTPLWLAYIQPYAAEEEVSADIRAFMKWTLDNPGRPLPGESPTALLAA